MITNRRWRSPQAFLLGKSLVKAWVFCRALAAVITKELLPAQRSLTATLPPTHPSPRHCLRLVACVFQVCGTIVVGTIVVGFTRGRVQWYTLMVFFDTSEKLCMASTGLVSPSRMALPTVVAQKRINLRVTIGDRARRQEIRGHLI